MSPLAHLVIVPVVLPLAAGAAMLLMNERRFAAKAALAALASLASLAAGVALVALADAGAPLVYRLGNWPAPFGIVLVADRLSAALVLLASTLALACISSAAARWHRAGPQFHPLALFLLMGVNGAVLTGDLFNLFVFVEVLLAASYALALHGSGPARVRSSLHYITVNLVASLLFLVGAAMLYGCTGTLNLADLALRAPLLADAERTLFEAGAAILGVAFLAKAGMWPLCFWLPGTYSAASAPAAAFFAILTKVGVYIVLRVWLLLFGEDAGVSAGFGGPVLVAGGMATLAFGTIGVLASQDLGRIASYALIVSAGTLLAAIGAGGVALAGAALYYLVASTLGAAALFLLVELLERGRSLGAGVLAVTAEAFRERRYEPEDLDVDEEEEPGVAIPATMALLSLGFAGAALVLAGLPPLAGFVGKLAMLHALLEIDPIPPTSWAMVAMLVVSGLATLIGLARAGVRRFWADPGEAPRVRVFEMAPILVLLALAGWLTVSAGGAIRYFDDAARALHAPGGYVRSVLPP